MTRGKFSSGSHAGRELRHGTDIIKRRHPQVRPERVLEIASRYAVASGKLADHEKNPASQ
jgi:hypothetical protein